jgi:hypothetical protein
MKKILLLTLIFLLASCSHNPNSVPSNSASPAAQTSPLSQPELKPWFADTPVAIDDLDLQALAIQDGDLPPGYQGGQVLDGLPKIFEGIPPTELAFYQLIEREGSGAGGVAILFFTDADQVSQAYDQLHKSMVIEETESISGLGERAEVYIFYQAGVSFRFVDALFESCGAVVHIRLGDTFNKDEAVNYAQKLEQRLSMVICQ